MLLNRLQELIGSRRSPLISLEVNPPRGTEVAKAIERVRPFVSDLDCVNVTDSALARMRSAAIPFASILKRELGVEPLVNISCRDRNVVALQADLLAGWTLGIRSVVALTGDAMSVGDSPDRKGVFEINSIGLLGMIAQLNGGSDLVGNALEGAPAYLPGVVVNPNVRNPAVELRRLEKKKQAGAAYALSQPIFEAVQAAQFFRLAADIGIPILAGLVAWRNSKSALGMARVPGIRLPEALVRELEATPSDQDLTESSVAYSLTLAEACRPFVAGFHIVSGSAPKLALKLCSALRRQFAQSR